MTKSAGLDNLGEAVDLLRGIEKVILTLGNNYIEKVDNRARMNEAIKLIEDYIND